MKWAQENKTYKCNFQQIVCGLSLAWLVVTKWTDAEFKVYHLSSEFFLSVLMSTGMGEIKGSCNIWR